MIKKYKPKITLFSCINSFDSRMLLPESSGGSYELKEVKMACSSMVKDVFLLRAFEAGSDAVVVFVCPEGTCRYVEGNIRAKKRVNFVKALLDEIGLGGRRLSVHNVDSGDTSNAVEILRQTLSDINDMGPNPAK
jgi:F420-non-reducing hydrogenase iron-sulfur subunit